MFSALLKVRARARFYSYATKIFVCRDRVEASGGNGVDVVKYWNAAIACSKAMKFSVIASKRTMFVFRRGEGKKVEMGSVGEVDQSISSMEIGKEGRIGMVENNLLIGDEPKLVNHVIVEGREYKVFEVLE
ncbi:hypothetical protein V6N13_106919 [Hibiscus sabdariffa]